MARRRLSLSRHDSTAPRLPGFLQRSSGWQRFSSFCSAHLNFYRVHLLAFTFIPLIAACIFYASNGPAPENQVAFIDALYMCVSAMCVTGLVTVLMVQLTVWQEVILAILTSIGGLSFVSIIVLSIRRQFFKNKLAYMVQNNAEARDRVNAVGAEEAARERRPYRPFDGPPGSKRFDQKAAPSPAYTPGDSRVPTPNEDSSLSKKRSDAERTRKAKKAGRLVPNMIRRIDEPVRINEMNVSGRLEERHAADADDLEMSDFPITALSRAGSRERQPSDGSMLHDSPRPDDSAVSDDEDGQKMQSDPGHGGSESAEPGILQRGQREQPTRAIQINEPRRPDRPSPRRNSETAATHHTSATASGVAFSRTRTLDTVPLHDVQEAGSETDEPRAHGRANLDVGRTRTIEFAERDVRGRPSRLYGPTDPDFMGPQRRPSRSNLMDRDLASRTLTRTATIDHAAMNTDFGGFPNPFTAAVSLAQDKIPILRHATDNNPAMPRTTTILSTHSHPDASLSGFQYGVAGSVKPVSYITFDAIVGRNSRFHGLTKAQQEELGGVEYRALSLLLKILVVYWAGLQLIAIAMLAPYLTYKERWRTVIVEAGANPVWFTFFQFISSYCNLGMSLVDASLIPFQQCYFLLIMQGLLILAGNTAYPVFLRLVIWTMSKVVPKQSRTRETLQFLLDHPRRCFIYLFPSHQTWFLVFLLAVLNAIDWTAFCVLDIGTPIIEAIPVGTRIIDGLFQAIAVRNAGFSDVAIGSVAPALQLLFVIMMYIAAYPIAISVRSTNVYEEKSMGVFDEDFEEDPDDVEARYRTRSPAHFIGYHARKQLAFDLWWLALAIWLLCIIERGKINSGNWPEVNIFALIFECVSAYGNVGLSLGNNVNAASLSAVLSTLSKLIICAVMIRGRHRGLPVAIDRAVLLPSDLEKHGDDTITASDADERRSRLGRRASLNSMATATPRTHGGLGLVEPLTDDARFALGRADSHDSGPRSGAATVRSLHRTASPEKGILDSPPLAPSSSDTSDDKDAGLVSSSSGAGTTTSLESDKHAGGEDHLAEIQALDRDQPGWR